MKVRTGAHRREPFATMKASRLLGILFALALIGLFVVGCGGGSDEQEAAQQQPTAADTGSSVPSTESSSGLEIPAGPPEPPCEATDDYGCFVPAPPEPGTEIPSSDVTFAVRPAPDNAMYIIGLESGFYSDVGINLNLLKATIENAIPLVLSGDADLGAMYAPALVPTLPTQKSVKQVMFTDDFVAFHIFADPDLGLKTVSDYLAEGMPIQEALEATLQPIIDSGEKLATTPLIDTRPFINIAFESAGLSPPELLVVDDPQNLVLARSGQIKFSTPTSASHIVTFLRQGWTPLVGVGDLLDNLPGGPDEPVQQLVGTVGVDGNRDWVEQNPNTLLRFVAATFRQTAEILADQGKAGGLLAIEVPYINSYAGVDLDEAGLWEIFSRLDPLVGWEDQTRYFEDEQDPRLYKTAMTALINQYEEDGVLEGGNTPDDVVWAGMVYDTLEWYQAETDKIFDALEGQTLSAEQEELLQSARQHYEWFNFLDAFRFAKAAAES